MVLCALSVNVGVSGILLYELASWLHIVAHKHGEYLVSLRSVLYGNLLEQSALGVHGSFPQLLGVHLSKTFVTLSMQGLVIIASVYILVDESLSLLLCVAILADFLVGTLVEWWSRYVEMAFLNDFRHEAIEECHDKSVDV